MSWIVVLSTFSAILVATILILSYYTPLRRTSHYVLFAATIGWFIPFSIVLLFPIDLASTTADNICRSDPESCSRPVFYLNDTTLLLCWRISYWTTFALTWVVLPLLQSYVDSGHRSPRKRLISAFRSNLRYQAIILGVFALGLVYILLTVQLNSFADFKSLLIALANTYGLVLVILCMGHGLVAIPRRIWQDSSLDTSLREIERTAVTAWESKSDAEDEAAVVSGEIASWERMCQGRDDPLANWVRELALRNPDIGTQSVPVDGMRLTEDYLSGLTRRARMSHNRLLKAQTHWNRILRRAGYLYDLKSAAGTSGRTIEWKLSQPGRVGKMVPSMLQYVWFLDVLPWLAKGFAVIVTAASVAIVWSEIVHNWNSPVLSLVGIIIRSTRRHWFVLELMSISILLYMAYATYSSFMRLKILNMYSLTPRHTDPVSILFYASYLCRLTYPSLKNLSNLRVPLTYNFTSLLAPPRDDNLLSTFSGFLGSNINLTPLGSGFNAWFPLLILVPVLFTTFRFYDKIRNVLGLGDLGGWIVDDEEDEENGEIVSVVEGRGILKQELGLPGGTVARRTARPTRTPSTGYSDEDEDDDALTGENFFVATGHRLWNSISTRVDDLRSDASSGSTHGTSAGSGDDSEESGLLGRIRRPKWLKRGDSGVGVWRLPKFGRGGNEGRVEI